MEVVVAYSHCVRELGIVCLGDQLTVKHRNLMKPPALLCNNTHTPFDYRYRPGTEGWGHVHSQLVGAGHGPHVIQVDGIKDADNTIGTADKDVILPCRHTCSIGGLQKQRERTQIYPQYYF